MRKYTFKDFQSPLFNEEDFETLAKFNPITFMALGLRIPLMTPATRDNIALYIFPKNSRVIRGYENLAKAFNDKGIWYLDIEKHPIGTFQKYLTGWDMQAYNVAVTTLARHNCNIAMLNSLTYKGIEALTLGITVPEDLKNTLIDLECPYWEELTEFKKTIGSNPSVLSIDMPSNSVDFSWDRIEYGVCYNAAAEAIQAVTPYVHPSNLNALKCLNTNYRHHHIKYIFINGKLTEAIFYYLLEPTINTFVIDYKIKL